MRRSGHRADFKRQAAKYEAMMEQLLERHRAADALPVAAKPQTTHGSLGSFSVR
jgi:hypothetical protein